MDNYYILSWKLARQMLVKDWINAGYNLDKFWNWYKI